MKKLNLWILAANTALALFLIGSGRTAILETRAETYSQSTDVMQNYLDFLNSQSSGQTQETTAAVQETTAAAQESTGSSQGGIFSDWAAGKKDTVQEPSVYSDPNAEISGNPFNDTASGRNTQSGGTDQSTAASSAASQEAAGTVRKNRPFEPPVMGETPDKKAISGGIWNQEQSGEWTYYLRDGSMARNVWVLDKGKYYYVDYTGCMMRNNYSADGFWVLGDGTWDRTSEQRTVDQLVAAYSGMRYGTDPYWTFDYTGTGNGKYDFKAVKTYSFGATETRTCRPVGFGVYILMLDDGTVVGQMGVSNDKNWVMVSEGGFTENYQVQQ